MKRSLGRALGIVATLASLGFLVWLARERSAELPEIAWTPDLLAASAVGLGLYLVGLCLGGLAWHQLLGDARRHLTPATSTALLLRTGVVKYLPGNVGHLLGRAVLARRFGVPQPAVWVSLVLESAVAAVVALGVGVVGLAADRLLWADVLARLPSPGRLALGLAALGAVILGLWLLPRLFAGRLAGADPRALGVGRRQIATAGGLFLVNFVLYGAMARLMARGLAEPDAASAAGLADGTWLRFTVAFAAAWVLGFLVPGSPGGLGVRETVLVLLLAPVTGAPQALVLSLALRLLTVVGDGLAFVLSFARPLGPARD